MEHSLQVYGAGRDQPLFSAIEHQDLKAIQRVY